MLSPSSLPGKIGNFINFTNYRKFNYLRGIPLKLHFIKYYLGNITLHDDSSCVERKTFNSLNILCDLRHYRLPVPGTLIR